MRSVPYFVPIVGESFCEPALRRLRRQLRRESVEIAALFEEKVDADEGFEFRAMLTAEPTNPHDANAVKVLGPDGELLGYLRRDVAADYASQIGVDGLACDAALHGGTRTRPSIGVFIRIEHFMSQLRRKAKSEARKGGEV